MIILLDNTGRAFSFVWDYDAGKLESTNNTYEIDEIAENKSLINDITRSFEPGFQSPYMVVNGELQKNGIPVTVEIDLDKQELKQLYTSIIDRLEQIETTDPSGTQAQILSQIVSAIQDMAKYQRKTLIVLRKLLG